jgi:pyruvate dehydrogenase E1 component
MSDLNPLETREWLDALDSVVVFDGADRTTFLLDELLNGARRNGAPVPYSANTPFLNTIPPVRETPHPGDQEIEYKIRSLIRWKGDAVGGVRRPRGGPGSGSPRTRRRPPA